MRRRVVALLVAFVVAGAPAALEACHVACAMSTDAASQSKSGASEHSCHHQTDAHRGSAVAAVHVCGHADAPPSAATGQVSPLAPALIAMVPPVWWAFVVDRSVPIHVERVSAKGILQTITQLRV